MKRSVIPNMLIITALILVLFLLNVALGSVSIPTRAAWNILWGAADQDPIWTNIILKSRVPQTLVAIVAGAGLAISGLHMQTVFRNPLAGPSVRCQSGRCIRSTAFGQHRRRCTEPSGICR